VAAVSKREEVVAARGLSARERAPLWRARLRVREAVSRSLTLIPVTYLGAAVSLGILLPVIDRSRAPTHVLGISASSAQSILEAVAGGMIAFSGLVVSVAVLVVQFGAGQYSPRLVQVFRKDPVIKNALGLLVAPGVYALVAVADVGGSTNDNPETLTVVIALVLMVMALAALFRFIGRLLDLMRPRQIYARLMREIGPALDDVYPRQDFTADDPPVLEMPAGETVRCNRRGGVLAAVDRGRLVRIARDADALIEVTAQIGSMVADDAPIVVVRGGSTVDARALHGSFVFSDGRSLTQDPAFGIRCIVDVVVRALSAAVNDPTSAVEGLDALDVLLAELADRPLRASAIRDEDGAVRLVLPTPDWDELLDLALTEIRWYGAGTPQVTRRLSALLENLASVVPQERCDSVARHRMLLEEHLEQIYPDTLERSFAIKPDVMGIGGRRASRSGEASSVDGRRPPDPADDADPADDGIVGAGVPDPPT
jgi:uncharacterized membrane protein